MPRRSGWIRRFPVVVSWLLLACSGAPENAYEASSEPLELQVPRGERLEISVEVPPTGEPELVFEGPATSEPPVFSLPGSGICAPPAGFQFQLAASCEISPAGSWACGGGPWVCIPHKAANTDADCAKYKDRLYQESRSNALASCKAKGVTCKNKSCSGTCVLEADLDAKTKAAAKVELSRGAGFYCAANEDVCRYDQYSFDCVCECVVI